MSVEAVSSVPPRAEATPARGKRPSDAAARYSLHLPNMAELLAQAAVHHPDKEALFDDAQSLTFRQMESASRRFAAFLRSKGVVKGSRIAFCAPKSVPLVVAVLGCLKAGAIYVPVDSRVPKSRILHILGDVAPRFVVAGREFYERLLADSQLSSELIATEDLARHFTFSDAADALPSIAAGDVAYCLYTSGSTGRPKGVLIEHGSVSAFFRALAEIMTQDADSRCMNTSELYFDVHVMDLFFPLFRGASVHLSCGPLIADRLLKTIEEERITHFTAVGPVMTLMTQGRRFDRCDLSSLVRVMTGAEIISVDTMQRWLRKVPGLTLVNGYGPTEATVICTAYLIDQPEPERTELYPIGKPMPGTEVLLVDDDRILTRPGEPGELLIGGPQVMKGYWKNERHTAEKIVHIGGERYYRSGDICRWLPTGDLHYVGRNDEQVKVSGFRVNLNEIKRVLDAAPSVREGHPVVLDHPVFGKVIGACLLDRDGRSEKEDFFRGLQSFLKEHLPYYMVPTLYFLFDAFPQLGSGKTDKKDMARRAEAAVEGADTRLTRFDCRARGSRHAGEVDSAEF